MQNLEFDINNILDRFPYINYKLLTMFSQTVTNNELFKENTKYFVLKSEGKKSYLWFTYFKDKILCILCIINDKLHHHNNKYYCYDIKFDNQLLYNNTVLYGYFFTKNGVNYFILENILNYNNLNYFIINPENHNSFKKKLYLYKCVMENITSSELCKVYLPYISNSLEDIYKNYYKIEYNIYGISLYTNDKYIGNYIIKNNKMKIIATFKVSACIEHDKYNLFIIDNNNHYKLYDQALINSYKLSVYMNNIFRTIKENSNLDLLEMSDDENEFENVNIDKYVNLDTECVMDCYYNVKFKRWIPIYKSNNKVSNLNYLNGLRLNYQNKSINYNNNNNKYSNYNKHNNYKNNNNNNNKNYYKSIR